MPERRCGLADLGLRVEQTATLGEAGPWCAAAARSSSSWSISSVLNVRSHSTRATRQARHRSRNSPSMVSMSRRFPAVLLNSPYDLLLTH